MNYGTTDKEALAIMDALKSFAHILMGREFTIVTDHIALTYLYGARNPTKKQMRWRSEIGKFQTKIIYKPGATNHLADALSRIYEDQEPKTEEESQIIDDDIEDEHSPYTPIYFTGPSLRMSTSNYYEPIGAHSECGSDCSITEGNTWGDKVTLPSTPPEQREHAMLHKSYCYDNSCPYHKEVKNFYDETKSSAPPKKETTNVNSIPDSIFKDLSRIHGDQDPKTDTESVYNDWEDYLAGPQEPIQTKVTIIPPTMKEHRRGLYKIFEDDDKPADDTSHLERVEDERDAASVTAQMTTVFRAQMIAAYRKDALYKMVMDSGHPNKDLQHYRISDGMVYATTRRGENCLYIPKGHGVNGESLRELVIDEIHGKGHHSAERNLRYATEYLFWPEMRKDFTDYIRQCQLCQENRENYALPQGRMQIMPIPTEIFTSYAIDMAGPFNTSSGKDTILVVVDRCVGFAWFIPTTAKAMASETLSLLQDKIFTTYGTPISIVTDSDTRFTS